MAKHEDDASPDPASTDAEAHVERVLGQILRGVADPATLYRVAGLLDKQIGYLKALGVAQLVEVGGYDLAMRQLGVKRAYLDRLMTQHGQHKPRDTEPRSPAYAYGRLLGVYYALARAADPHSGIKPIRECEKLLVNASRSTTVLPKLRGAGTRWLKTMPPARRGVWREEIAGATAAATDLGSRYLTIAEQGEVILGQAAYARDRETKDA